MRFFTSDTHFMGKDILERENRPFKDEYEFIDYIVSLWNSQIGNYNVKRPVIYHIGDFTNFNVNEYSYGLEGLKVVKKVNADIILIIGNNEERIVNSKFNSNFIEFKNYCKEIGFKDVYEELYITINNRLCYLNHYPIKHKSGIVNLFGHTHRTTGLWKPYGLNIGCDLNHFRLFSEEDVIKMLWYKENHWDFDVNDNCMV